MRLITDVLRDIRKGRPVEEATMALADVVRAVDETGKEGSVTIVLKVKPSKHGGPEKTLIAEVKAKKPIAEIAPAVFFQIVVDIAERTSCPAVFGKSEN
jgi:hypothetical protein